MSQIFKDTLALLLGAVAHVVTPTIRHYLRRLCSKLGSDTPLLETAWVVQFHDPTESGGARKRCIDASLEQYGRFVRGQGHIHGKPHDIFVYRGVIKRNALYGQFRRTDAHVLAGTGTFVLKIRADGNLLHGTCTWYDSLLDDVWCSEYAWKKN